MKIDTIGFDADDTLWHNEYLYYQGKQRLQEILSAYKSPEWVGQKLDETEEHNVRYYGYGIKSFALSMIETLVNLTGGKQDGGQVQAVLDIVHGMLSAEVRLMDDVQEVLAALVGRYRLLLITKGDTFEQERKIDRSGLKEYFFATEVVSQKAASAYQRVLDKYGIRPQGFLMVGNSLLSDILPVLEIGGQAVYIHYEITWAHEVPGEGSTTSSGYHEVEGLAQLPGLVDQLEKLEEA